MFNMNKEQSLLLVIDIQERLSKSMNNEEYNVFLEKNKILIRGCDILKLPIFQSLQYKKGLGESVDGLFAENIKKTDFEKRVFSCCYEGSEFIEFLSKNPSINQIIIIGMEAHVCVLQTVRDLINMKFNVIVPQECIISRDGDNKTNAINLMKSFGADIANVESILFDLLKTSLADEFKAISSLIK